MIVEMMYARKRVQKSLRVRCSLKEKRLMKPLSHTAIFCEGGTGEQEYGQMHSSNARDPHARI